MLNTILSIVPVLLLIWLMVKKRSVPSQRALPLSALILYFIVLFAFRFEPREVHANVISGLLLAWTPILIIGGAILLFKTMESTGALSVIKQWLNTVSENKVAQLMIVGWAFPFLIEGASGFGTPAAIAAPVLVGLGFHPLRVAILALIMNTVPVSFGAVGTPTWFGFSGILLTEKEALEIGFRSALIHASIALVIPLLALNQVIRWKSIFQNLPFILISIIATVVPYVIIAKYNYEFPSLVGGATGLVISAVAAKFGIGLSKQKVEQKEEGGERQKKKEANMQAHAARKVSTGRLLKATFPLWGTIVILILTRIPQLGIKSLITASEPGLTFSLGALGDFSLSASLVLSIENILRTDVGWTHALLYVPSFIPFLLISLLTFLWYAASPKEIASSFRMTFRQMRNPTIALLGALVFVNLMMMGGEDAAVNRIGIILAKVTGEYWTWFASFMGALGSFFSGSATISNLTFAGIQDAIAASLGLDRTLVLALQSVGASLGNMVCINNIVAVASILALGNVEGKILKRTAFPMLVYGVLAGILGVVFF